MNKILLTGGSGFLGNIITKEFPSNNIITLGRTHSDIAVQLNLEIPILPEADLIIHAAGKAHAVPKNAKEKQDFFDVNVLGTQNLLRALENNKLPRSFVFISSVSVYGNETGHLISEESPLNARDAYGRSKIEAERIIQEWCVKHKVTCTILRLPLLIGPNAPGNLEAMVNGIKRGYYFNIAGGTARKSMVLAQDVAGIILKSSAIGGTFNLTDGYHPTFFELSYEIAKQLKKSKPLNIHRWQAKILSFAGDLIGPKFPLNSSKLNKIISDLTFDDAKAVKILGWKPQPVLDGIKIN